MCRYFGGTGKLGTPLIILRVGTRRYLALTQAVRVGDLARFSAVVKEFRPTFEADKNYTLILRLRHNVIKTGVRMISLS